MSTLVYPASDVLHNTSDAMSCWTGQFPKPINGNYTSSVFTYRPSDVTGLRLPHLQLHAGRGRGVIA